LSLKAQTINYPYELIKGKDTTVTLLKSQAIYLNQTIARQREKINAYKIETDSLKTSNSELDSLFFEAGKSAVYYKFESDKLKVENVKLKTRLKNSVSLDLYMSSMGTILFIFWTDLIINH
jgi:hypothetical protein